MLKTQVRPSRDLRNNYSEIRTLLSDHDHVIITNNGKGDSVLINFDDFAEYEEFIHTKYINQKLDDSLIKYKNGTSQLKNHEDFWSNIEANYEI